MKAAGNGGPTPAVIKRLLRWSDVQSLLTVAIVAIVLWNRFGDPDFLPDRIAIPLYLAMAAAGLAAAVLRRRGWRRFRRAYSASGGRLCTGCGHTLVGLGDSGTCPECGQPFDLPRDRAAWRANSLVELPADPA